MCIRTYYMLHVYSYDVLNIQIKISKTIFSLLTDPTPIFCFFFEGCSSSSESFKNA